MTTAPLETAALAQQTGATIPIPIVSTLDFGSDPDEFYRLHAAHPVIVRDCFPAGHPLMNLDLDAIEKLMGQHPHPRLRRGGGILWRSPGEGRV
jgi:hypothetical protein